MNSRRLSQLERAAKLKANVSVLLGPRYEAPLVVDLDHVKRTSLLLASRMTVQALSWIDAKAPVVESSREIPGGDVGFTEEDLAETVDRALDLFEEKRRAPETKRGSA